MHRSPIYWLSLVAISAFATTLVWFYEIPLLHVYAPAWIVTWIYYGGNVHAMDGGWESWFVFILPAFINTYVYTILAAAPISVFRKIRGKMVK